MMKGYKVFNPDWTCRGFQFEVGKIFEENVEPVCCNRGFHFCTKAADCFNYYSFNSANKVAEVEAFGAVDASSENSKCCTNKIHIIRELTWHEVLDLVNIGKDCSGFCNSGDYNSGYCNSGDWNSGDWNSGDFNSGNRNSGNRNSGNFNSGDRNSGSWNSGNWNSGDWNKTNFSSGCFNTEEQKIVMFDKPSDWTIKDWWNSDAKSILSRIPRNAVEWVNSNRMTDEEKKAHPEHETTNGYLKVFNKHDSGQIWWNNLTTKHKNIIKNLPNFDSEKFYICTGIKVE